MDIKEVTILGDDLKKHFYYISKGRALIHLIKNFNFSCESVLDVGAGSGVFSRQLLDTSLCQKAVCVDLAYDKEYTEIYNQKTMTFVQSIDRPTQDLILMMDVLEHVDDDVGFLRKYTEDIPLDCKVIITVPAFQFLWSGHDVFLEHHRRYTYNHLQRVVQEAGLEVITIRYFFLFLFPVAAALRLWKYQKLKQGNIKAQSDLKTYPSFVNASLTAIHDIERLLLFPLNRLAGLTIFCLARKP